MPCFMQASRCVARISSAHARSSSVILNRCSVSDSIPEITWRLMCESSKRLARDTALGCFISYSPDSPDSPDSPVKFPGYACSINFLRPRIDAGILQSLGAAGKLFLYWFVVRPEIRAVDGGFEFARDAEVGKPFIDEGGDLLFG